MADDDVKPLFVGPQKTLQQLTACHTWVPDGIENLVSNTFCSGKHPAVKWRLQLRKVLPEFIIVLYLESSDQLDLHCGVWLSIEYEGKKDVLKKGAKHTFSEVGEKFTLKHMHYLEELIEDRELAIEVKVQFVVNVFSSLKNMKACHNLAPNSFLEDMHSLLGKRSTGDLTLTFRGDKKIKLHKAVVEVRCPELAADLKWPLREERYIKDVDPDAMGDVVNYMYTDQVDDIDTKAHKLYPVACKFKILNLIAKCEDSMVNSLTARNAMKTYSLAKDKPGGFKTRVADFIKTHKREVMETDEFKNDAFSNMFSK